MVSLDTPVGLESAGWPSVGGEQGLRRRLFGNRGLVDPLAHVRGAAAALWAMAAGAKNVHWAPRSGTDGGIDIAISNGTADADIHSGGVFLSMCSCDLLA